MAYTPSNVSVGKPNISGSVHRAPAGSVVPTDATTALAADYKDLGYASEDGLTNTIDISTEQIRAWGGDVVLEPETEFTDTFQITLIEALNTDVLMSVYGSGNVTGTLSTGIAVDIKPAAREAAVWVFDTVLTGGVMRRIVLPNAKVTSIGDIVYVDNEPIGYEITLSAMADGTGVTHHEYTAA